jgi:hypothetical protein
MVLLVAVLAWDRLAVPNLLPAAVGVIALFVLFEKTMPWGDWMGRFTGLVLIGWGCDRPDPYAYQVAYACKCGNRMRPGLAVVYTNCGVVSPKIT